MGFLSGFLKIGFVENYGLNPTFYVSIRSGNFKSELFEWGLKQDFKMLKPTWKKTISPELPQQPQL